MNIRNSAKALIIQEEKVLFIQCVDSKGNFYLLPGGGQEYRETLDQAVKRECLEEIGVEVQVGELVFIREYIGKNHEFASFDYEAHQVDFIFECEIVGDDLPQLGLNPDSDQKGVEWLPIDSLESFRVYPSRLKKAIYEYVVEKKSSSVYLGDVN